MKTIVLQCNSWSKKDRNDIFLFTLIKEISRQPNRDKYELSNCLHLPLGRFEEILQIGMDKGIIIENNSLYSIADDITIICYDKEKFLSSTRFF